MKKIVVLPGDGIGPEIMASALAVLEKSVSGTEYAFECVSYLFGGAAIDVHGVPLPDETIEACHQADAILMGAIGGPKWEHFVETPEKGLLALRKELALYANIRPIVVPDSLLALSPVKESIVKGTDFVVVRELTSGIYFGEPRELGTEEAYDTNRYHASEIRRIAIVAFELAQTRRKHVLSVDKANVLATSKLWRKVVEEVALDYPECTLEHQYVDSAAMRMIQHPTSLDVVVTENLFGDILSDEASVLPGSLGVLPSASHSTSGASLYEPIHGSAPDIAGKDVANPVSMIFSVSLMLRESFGYHEIADRIDQACFDVMASGFVTRDLGGIASTSAFTKAVLENLE